MTTQTRITISGLKVAKFASEETLCFSAKVAFDGVIFAAASNDGHGGCTFVRALEGKSQRMADAEAFAATIATEKTFDGHLTDIVDDLVCAEDDRKTVERAFKRDMKSKVLFVRNGALSYFKIPRGVAVEKVVAHAHKKYPEAQLLNEMSPQAAWIVYSQMVGAA